MWYQSLYTAKWPSYIYIHSFLNVLFHMAYSKILAIIWNSFLYIRLGSMFVN